MIQREIADLLRSVRWQDDGPDYEEMARAVGQHIDGQVAALHAQLAEARRALLGAAEYLESAGVLREWRAEYAATIRAAWEEVWK